MLLKGMPVATSTPAFRVPANVGPVRVPSPVTHGNKQEQGDGLAAEEQFGKDSKKLYILFIKQLVNCVLVS